MIRKLDLIVGMQYGDEGKGASAAMLHLEKDYQFAVRTGGSQAEHRYINGDVNHRFRVLPSIAGIDGDVDFYLTAGMIIRRDILQSEVIKHCIDPDRVFIDKNAAVVETDEINDSKMQSSYGRGGYAMGISGTLIRKIMRDPLDIPLASQYDWDGIGTLADVNKMVAGAISDGDSGLLEASQGALLSLDHGFYPHVTSYNVTAPAVMSSLGLGFDFVRDVYGIIRAYPIRVAGDNAGRMLGDRTTFDRIEKISGAEIPPERRWQSDEDGTSMGTENIAEFSMSELRHAILLNTPTKLILTHADWLEPLYKTMLITDIETHAAHILGTSIPITYVRRGEKLEDYYRRC